MAGVSTCYMNGTSMAEKLGLGPEVRELKLGPSFTNRGTAFHTLRCRFFISLKLQLVLRPMVE